MNLLSSIHLRRLASVAAGALCMAGAPMAHGAVISVSETLDLTQASFASSGFTGVQGDPNVVTAFSPVFSVTIAQGDTFDYTIDFKGQQSLTLSNPSFLWAFSYADTATNVTGTGTLSLLGADGTPFLTSSVKTDSEGAAHFGQQFDPSDFGGTLPASLTFYGVHYVGTVDGYDDGVTTERTYDTPALFFTSDASTVNAVPEPATWAMMISGFGLIGGAMRRRDTKIAVAYR